MFSVQEGRHRRRPWQSDLERPRESWTSRGKYIAASSTTANAEVIQLTSVDASGSEADITKGQEECLPALERGGGAGCRHFCGPQRASSARK